MLAELPVPPDANSDRNACELVRAWAAHGGLQCSLDVDVFPEEHALIGWGILLSDIARHVADALYERKNIDRSQTLSEIRAVFNSELNSPTAGTQGQFT